MITYPLNNIEYTAEDAELYNVPRTSGVYAEEDFSISVSSSGYTVTVSPGIAWIRNARFAGKVVAEKSATTLDLGAADASSPRIDVVAIQFDYSRNETNLVVKKGIPSGSPVMPIRSTTEALYELYLYSFYRSPAESVINESSMTDLRMDPQYCGLMANSVTNFAEYFSLADYEGKPTPENADIWKVGDRLALQMSGLSFCGNSVTRFESDVPFDFANKIRASTPIGEDSSIDAGYGRVSSVANPVNNDDAVNKRFLEQSIKATKESHSVTLGNAGTDILYSFVKSGKTVFFKISKVVSSSISASSGGILIPIPEAFKPVAECATGEASTEVLWKRGGYAASPVGSLSVSDQQNVRLYYDFSQDTPTSGTTLGATMIWICV